MATITK